MDFETNLFTVFVKRAHVGYAKKNIKQFLNLKQARKL